MPEDAECVFQGVIFDIYQWEQENYEGKRATYEKIKRKDTAVVIAVTIDKKIIVIEQEQPGHTAPYMSCVSGRLDPGENPLEAAQRELLEETGHQSDDWELFNAGHVSTKIDWVIYTFIARGCKKISEQNLDGGEKIKLFYVDFDEFVDLVLGDSFDDLGMKVAFLKAKLDPKKMDEIKRQLGIL